MEPPSPSESPPPQLKRKLTSGENDAEPLGKSPRFEDEPQPNQIESPSAADEIQRLIGRHTEAKAIIEREYDEAIMGPSGDGEHADFLKEMQSRAEIVNSGAIQNEGNKEKLLSQLGNKELTKDSVDDDEAAALAIIRETMTGEEDDSVLIATPSNGKESTEKMHEATGIPKDLKFEINIQDDAETSQPDGEPEINFDVVISANPKLNLDAFKAKSSLAHKGTMAHRRLPTRGHAIAPAPSTSPEPSVTKKEEASEMAAPYKCGASTADKVRAVLATKEDESAQDILAAQRRALKQSYRPDAGFATESNNNDDLQQELKSPSPSSSSGGNDDVKSYKPSLAKLAALERRPRTKSSSGAALDAARGKLKSRKDVEEEKGKIRKTGDLPPESELAGVIQRVRSVSVSSKAITESTEEDSSSFEERLRLRSESKERSPARSEERVRKTGNALERYTKERESATEKEVTASPTPTSPRSGRHSFGRRPSGSASGNLFKPSFVPSPSAAVDAVPEWKKALLKRRKMSGSGGIGGARLLKTSPESVTEIDEVPAWKKELLKRRKEGEKKRSVPSMGAEEGRKEPTWVERANRTKMKDEESVNRLTNRLARVSVSEEEEKGVPSFLKEFQSKQRKSRHESGKIEPEWMKRLNRKKSSPVAADDISYV